MFYLKTLVAQWQTLYLSTLQFKEIITSEKCELTIRSDTLLAVGLRAVTMVAHTLAC